jgi:hypothetical protein
MSDRQITKEDVTYYSDGLKIAAHLYRPAGMKESEAKRPAVLCLTGYSGRKTVATVDLPARPRGSSRPRPTVAATARGCAAPAAEQVQDSYDGINTSDRASVDPDGSAARVSRRWRLGRGLRPAGHGGGLIGGRA